MICIFVILGVSCLATVPLMNWSRTVRYLGSPINVKADLRAIETTLSRDGEESPRTKKMDFGARIIIMYWGFLVLLGFICSFIAIYNKSYWWFVHWISIPTSQDGHTRSIVCAPLSGQLDTSLAYLDGSDNREECTSFVLSHEFIRNNQCTNPCSTPRIGRTIFRDITGLRTANLAEMNFILTWSMSINTSMRANVWHITAISVSVRYVWRYVPLILAQGIWATSLGRRSPSEARNLVYAMVYNLRLLAKRKVPLNRWAAYWSAMFTHLAALMVFALCPPLFLLAILAAELFLWHLPESESSISIGAWGPLASTALVLSGAFIARYHHKFIDKFAHPNIEFIISFPSRFLRAMQVIWSRLKNPSQMERFTPRKMGWPHLSLSACVDFCAIMVPHFYHFVFHLISRVFNPVLRTIGISIHSLVKRVVDECIDFVGFCRDPQPGRDSAGLLENHGPVHIQISDLSTVLPSCTQSHGSGPDISLSREELPVIIEPIYDPISDNPEQVQAAAFRPPSADKSLSHNPSAATSRVSVWPSTCQYTINALDLEQPLHVPHRANHPPDSPSITLDEECPVI